MLSGIIMLSAVRRRSAGVDIAAGVEMDGAVHTMQEATSTPEAPGIGDDRLERSGSSRDPAAVHHERLASYEGRGIGQQERYGRRDLVWPTKSTDGVLRSEIVALVSR